MKFPNFVYKTPGMHQCNGGTYDYALVLDDDELRAKLKGGWSETLEGALSGKPEPSISREQLEADAARLGVKFNKRTTDETLIERINEALESNGLD